MRGKQRCTTCWTKRKQPSLVRKGQALLRRKSSSHEGLPWIIDYSWIKGQGGWSLEVKQLFSQNHPIRDSSSIGRALQREGILLLNALDIGSSPVYPTSPVIALANYKTEWRMYSNAWQPGKTGINSIIWGDVKLKQKKNYYTMDTKM